jgi:hypothetical protein
MSVFNDENHESLQSKFQNMINPTLVEEKVKPVEKKVIVENNEVSPKTETIKENTQSKAVGSKFNEIYNACYGDTLVSENDELSLGMGGEGEYEDEASIDYEGGEDDMIQVPSSVIRELYAYLEDSMGSEDGSDVENLDVELDLELEESNDGTPSALSNKLGDLVVKGKTVQNDKLGTRGIGKTGSGGGNGKDKSGTPQKLINILSHLIVKGSGRQNGLKVGEQPAK